MLKNVSNKTLVSLALWLVALLASCYIPLASLSGSFHQLLSGINFVLPVAGGLFGLGMVCSLVSSLWLFKTVFLTKALTFGIPSACAMLSWAANTQTYHATKVLNFTVNVLLPATCMAIFMLHPASSAAWPYALYWLIPIAIWAANHTNNHAKHSLLLALQSTFIAHAIGSTMWIFLVPMTTSQWLALIPIVAVERFGIALLAAGLHKIIVTITNQVVVKQKKAHRA